MPEVTAKSPSTEGFFECLQPAGTATSPRTESIDDLVARLNAEREAREHCRCDGTETHAHCYQCKSKIPEGEDYCEACDLKMREATCPACRGPFYLDKRDKGKAPFYFRNQGVCSADCQEWLLNRLLLKSGLPPDGSEKTLRNFDPHTSDLKRKLERLTAWKDGKISSGVFLVGPPGTGKTHLASALMRELCRRGFNGRFIKSFNFTQRCQASFVSGETVPKIIDELLSGLFLVLDDIGVEKTTEFMRSNLVSLIDEVVSRKKVLIATSNKTTDELALIDKRFSDRIPELCDTYEFSGASYRPRIAKARAKEASAKQVGVE